MAYKNTILFLIAIVLFVYGAFISIVPAIKTATFNIDEFEKKMFDATSLNVSIESIKYKLTPTFKTIIKVRGLDVSYIDYQPLFKAASIELTATPLALLDTKFDIKHLYVKNGLYRDQILPDGANKLDFLPGSFNTKIFGKNSIEIVPGPIRIRNLKIEYITPTTYDSQYIRDKEYEKEDVSAVLNRYHFANFKIK